MIYKISPVENDSYMFAYNYVGPDKCPNCGFRTDFENINLDFKLKKSNFDFSETYDCGLVVSEKFKQTCEDNNLFGLDFYPLIQTSGFYILKCNNTVQFDEIKKPIKRKNICTTCKIPKDIFDIFPITLKEKKLENTIYKTNIIAGWGNQKGHTYVCNERIVSLIKGDELTGFDYLNGEEYITQLE